MPGTNSRNLTLVREGANVRVTVTYNVVFTAFEHNLANLGMSFVERIGVLGIDPPGSFTGTVLAEFPAALIAVPAGSGPISLPRSRQVVLTRTQLDEDSSIIVGPDFDPDEIRCRIRIESHGLPPAVTSDAFTNQSILSAINVPAADSAVAAAASSTSD